MQVWSFTLLKNETRLVTGSSDPELRVYSISTEESSSSGGGGDEEVAKPGSKRKPDDNESRVSLHVTPLLNLLLLWYILPGLDPITVCGQLCG